MLKRIRFSVEPPRGLPMEHVFRLNQNLRICGILGARHRVLNKRSWHHSDPISFPEPRLDQASSTVFVWIEPQEESQFWMNKFPFVRCFKLIIGQITLNKKYEPPSLLNVLDSLLSKEFLCFAWRAVFMSRLLRNFSWTIPIKHFTGWHAFLWQ